jgi:hypothetical protein
LFAIPSSTPVPPKTAIDLLLESIDQDVERKRENEMENWSKLRKYLHAGLPRVSCFAFRGDDRDPLKLKSANGFMPGVTRPNEYVQKQPQAVRDTAAAIDNALRSMEPPAKAKRGKKAIKKQGEENARAYFEVLKRYATFNLGVYTTFQTFKGFISTTKSIPIAKSFANLYKGPDEAICQTWCYTVRCHGGYELPSYSAGVLDAVGNLKIDKEDLRKIHTFAAYFEQEISIAGALWWDQIVGFRLLDCTADGPLFAGPIYLREPRYWEVKQDRKAFNALFETLSGKSQGADDTIYKCYKRPPGDPWNLMPNAANAH